MILTRRELLLLPLALLFGRERRTGLTSWVWGVSGEPIYDFADPFLINE